MPRFSMKWLLFAFAIAALWLSTAVGYTAGDDVRAFIVLFLVTASVIATYCSRGRRKCFWLAFSFFLFMATFTQALMSPGMLWVNLSVRPYVTSVDIYGNMQPPMPSERVVEFYSTTIKLAVDLAFATLAGLIATSIYDRSSSASEPTK